MTPGSELPSFSHAVNAAAMRDWAVFLADSNPIHLDPEAVKAMGLGTRVINQGPANLAYVMNMLIQAFPGATIDEIEARFLDNVYAGENVTAGGVVNEVESGRIHCSIWLEADGSRCVISGTAIVRLA